MDKTLVEIRCPFKKLDKYTNKLIDCNRLCIKVYSGSSGEAKCTTCHLTFEFDVGEQKDDLTIKVPAQSVK